MGFTLNFFTLLGLSLAIGIVVDDAIMVLENIMRHREMGKSKVLASRDGARESPSRHSRQRSRGRDLSARGLHERKSSDASSFSSASRSPRRCSSHSWKRSRSRLCAARNSWARRGGATRSGPRASLINSDRRIVASSASASISLARHYRLHGDLSSLARHCLSVAEGIFTAPGPERLSDPRTDHRCPPPSPSQRASWSRRNKS